MVIKSRWAIPIPNSSLQKWIFGSATGALDGADAKAMIDADRPDTHFLTFGEYRLLSKRIGYGLQQAGLKPGERVLMFSGNNVYYPSAFLGVLMAGGVFSGANPSFVARELVYQLRDSGASFLLVAEESIDVALEAAAEVGLPKERVYIFDAKTDPRANRPAPGASGRQQGFKHWTELLQSDIAEADGWEWVEPADTKNTTCCLNYSSGTTGVPKGVEISHNSYVANCQQVVHMNEQVADFKERKARAVGLAFLPFYHAYGQTYFIANYPHQRIPVYIMPKFDFLKMLQHVEKYRVTALTCVPPIVVALAKHPAARKFDLSSVEAMGSGAAPLAAETAREAESLLNGVVTSQGWGMTEVTCTCMSWDDNLLKPSGGVGELMANCAAKLVELDGKTEILEAKKPGELWVTGPNLLQGYWKKPEATRDSMSIDPDGTRWFKTGDIAFIEEYRPGGIFHIIDRIKELIKVKGNQVAPAELEGVLLDHPDVADAGVVGVTIDGEEYPRAYIVKKPSAKATEKELADWIAGRVARYKQLRGGVAFVEAIPKNPVSSCPFSLSLRRAVRMLMRTNSPGRFSASSFERGPKKRLGIGMQGAPSCR